MPCLSSIFPGREGLEGKFFPDWVVQLFLPGSLIIFPALVVQVLCPGLQFLCKVALFASVSASLGSG